MKAEYDYFTTTGDHLLKQIKYLSSGQTPTTISQFDYTYNQDRTIDTWTIDQDDAVTDWALTYDAAMQLKTAVREDASDDVLDSFRYGYDDAGNRIHVEDGPTEAATTSTRTNYKVNNLNQLVSERGFGPTFFEGTTDEPATVTVDGVTARLDSSGGSGPYRFEAWVSLPEGENEVDIVATDGESNVTTDTYDVTTTGTTTLYEYDALGNLRYEREPNNDVRREFQWDQENRLVKIIDGDHETEMEYDGLSRRVRIRELENETEQSNTTFVWCGPRVCQERNSAGSSVTRSFLTRGMEVGSDEYYYTVDHLGSIREIVADDGSTLESAYHYSPWGEQTRIISSGEAGVELYTGHHLHEPSGLYLTYYRAYDPVSGHWLNRDPISEEGGINLYAYAENDPINYVDLFGLAKRNPGDVKWLTCSAAEEAFCVKECLPKSLVSCRSKRVFNPVHVKNKNGTTMVKYKWVKKWPPSCNCNDPDTEPTCSAACATAVALTVVACFLMGPLGAL